MASQQRTELRVFVSSTFRDLQEEREHLVKKIFPEVRARCRERGITFTEVDLRWGVTEADVTSGRVVRTCLEEIDRTRPYFLGIIGDRYGFVPQRQELSDPDLHAKFPWIEDALREGASLTDLEFRYGALNDLANAAGPGNAIFYARQRLARRDDADPDRMKLAALERRVRAKGFSVNGYQSAERLGELVRADLLTILDRDFADATPPTPLHAERMRHEAFASSRRHAYLPNAEYMQRLDAHVASDDAPLVIYAPSGAGKSSLVAHWANEFNNSKNLLPTHDEVEGRFLKQRKDFYLIEHYIGVGAGATDHFGVMRHLMEEIKFRYDRSEEIPGTPDELERQFANWFGFTLQNPVVIIIDGVNQLSGPAATLGWLPKYLPKNIRLIITATTEETRDELVARGWNQMVVHPLTRDEREQIIVQFLKDFGKALSKNEIERIASDPKSAHPLFLRTLLEELRIFGSHEMLSERVSRCLATRDTDELFQAVLERMELDFGAEGVRDIMSLLWAARTGLSEMELGDVSKRSQLDISMITTSLDYHLLRREGLLTFFHDFLRRAVEARYVKDDESKRLRHLALADYFEKIVMERVEPELEESIEQPQIMISLRLALEVTYQLEQAAEHERLARALVLQSIVDRLWEENQSNVLRLWSILSIQGYPPNDYYFVDQEKRSFGPSTLAFASKLFHMRSEFEIAHKLGQQLHTWATTYKNPKYLILSHCTIGRSYLTTGHYDEAMEHLNRARAIVETEHDDVQLTDILRQIGTIHQYQARYDEALEAFNQELELANKLGEKVAIANALGDVAAIYATRGHFEQSLPLFQEAYRLMRGNAIHMISALIRIGTVQRNLGHWNESLEALQEAIELARGIDDVRMLAQAKNKLSELYSLQGHYSQAIALKKEQIVHFKNIQERRQISLSIGNLGFEYLNAGQNAEAFECFEEALLLSQEMGLRFMTAHWVAGCAMSTYGNAQSSIPLWKVKEWLSEALLLSQELNIKIIHVPSQILLSRIEADEMNFVSAAERLEMALSIETNEEQLALLHYWLWKIYRQSNGRISVEKQTEHHKSAIRCYSSLNRQLSKFEFQKHLAELRGESIPQSADDLIRS